MNLELKADLNHPAPESLMSWTREIAVACAFALAAAAPIAIKPANAAPPATPVMTAVLVNEAHSTITVQGTSFGTSGAVLTLDGYGNLPITSHVNTLIVAALPSAIASGSYLLSLAVSGKLDEFWLTIGTVGPTRATGPAGPQDVQGPAGIAGPIGPVGPQGSAGEMGATGAPGPQGAVGPQGSAGPEGPSGARFKTFPAGATAPEFGLMPQHIGVPPNWSWMSTSAGRFATGLAVSATTDPASHKTAWCITTLGRNLYFLSTGCGGVAYTVDPVLSEDQDLVLLQAGSPLLTFGADLLVDIYTPDFTQSPTNHSFASYMQAGSGSCINSATASPKGRPVTLTTQGVAFNNAFELRY